VIISPSFCDGKTILVSYVYGTFEHGRGTRLRGKKYCAGTHITQYDNNIVCFEILLYILFCHVLYAEKFGWIGEYDLINFLHCKYCIYLRYYIAVLYKQQNKLLIMILSLDIVKSQSLASFTFCSAKRHGQITVST